MSSCGAGLSSTSWPGSRPRAWAPRTKMHVQMKCANVMAAIAFSPTLARGRPRTCSGMRLWLRMAGGVRSDLGKRIGVPPKMGRTGQRAYGLRKSRLMACFLPRTCPRKAGADRTFVCHTFGGKRHSILPRT
jgi:hypothetical protein